MYIAIPRVKCYWYHAVRVFSVAGTGRFVIAEGKLNGANHRVNAIEWSMQPVLEPNRTSLKKPRLKG